jgi:choice-of-anchor B domain-containing protein
MHLRSITTFGLVCFGLSLATTSPADGQDRFGAAVALTDAGEVAVLKPGKAVGPAVTTICRMGEGGAWTSTAQLPKLDGGYPGEALTESLVSGGNLLLFGSGDPDGVEAGHLYQRQGGQWTASARVPLDPTAFDTSSGLPASGLDMATLMSLMGPPARTLAISPDGTRLAVAGGALPRGAIHVLRHEADAWTLESELSLPEGSAALGTALALDGDRLVAGTPAQGPGGAVHFFARDNTGWSPAGTFEADSSQVDFQLGTAVVLARSGGVFASAPGGGRVLRFAAGTGSGWTPRDEILAPAALDATSAAFGTTIAADEGRLLVGAPRADEDRGRAYTYTEADGQWALERTLTPDDIDGAAFGFSVALRGDRAVIGAPSAYGNDGRVAVFELDTSSDATWLDPGKELATVTGAEPVRCAEGEAAGFACESVDLVSFLPLSALGAEPGEGITDIWGWTDPETGREYVLAGRTAGLAFIDITDSGTPHFLGLMPANPSHARDIKVYRDHAFMTGDGAGDHGLLVFDLSRLRDVPVTPAMFEPDARYDEVASAHNLIVDTESGFAYTVGTNTGGQSCGGGLHMIDIREPLQPTFAGCYTDTEGLIWSGRTHDAQCTVYRGPDEAYQGRQICFASNETAMRIVDVTDKSAPTPISSASHPGTAYVHQGWLTEDHRYLYVNDELDEIVGTVDRTRTLIYDIAELDDPILVGEHLGPDQATDHNLFISGSRAYLANYQAGFRVLDVSDPEQPVEIGWFDTTPYGENPPGFGGGAWTAWPFFESGMVVVSSMNEGLFIVRPQRPVT